MACCAACAKGSNSPCAGGTCSTVSVVGVNARKPAPSFGAQTLFARNPFAPRSPRGRLVAVESVEEHVHMGDEAPAPTNAPFGPKRGQRVDDDGGDVWAQEHEHQPTGVLPGGLTQTEWNSMSAADRTAYVNRVATTDAARSQLIADSTREGLTGLSTIVLAIYAAEQARLTSAADREAARLRSRDAIELATIQADRDVRIAQAGGGAGALTAANRPTTGAQWDALTPAQQAAAGPRPPGMSKNMKTGLIIGGSVVGVAALAGIAYAVTK